MKQQKGRPYGVHAKIMVDFLAFHIPWEQNFWPKSSILIIEHAIYYIYKRHIGVYSCEKSIIIELPGTHFFFISLLSFLRVQKAA